jgi:site-specific recombinase XerD
LSLRRQKSVPKRVYEIGGSPEESCLLASNNNKYNDLFVVFNPETFLHAYFACGGVKTADKKVTLLDAGKGRLAAVAPFSEDFVHLMRSIPHASWNHIALRWEFPIESGRDFRRVFSAWLILSSEAAKNAGESSESVPSVPAHIAADMEDALRALKYSHKTISRYLSIIDRYARFINTPLQESGVDEATRFLSFLERDIGSSASTINQAISAIRFLYTRVLGREAPLARRPKADRRLPGVLSREEVMKILAAPHNLKHRVLLVLAYSAGLRVSEIAALRIRDVDSARGVILVHSGKGRKDRYTILACRTKRLLEAYINLYQPKLWLFEGQETGHISSRSIQEVFYKAKVSAGITKDVSIHSLRHSFATHLLEDGTDIRYIQELLGHANAKTTQIYTHIAKKDFLRIKSPYDRSDDP